MWKINNAHDPSAILKRAKYLLLLLSVVLIVANLYFLSATRQHAHSYSEQQNQATWFLLQLTKEFTELNTIAPFAADSQNYHDKVLLKYELTWSRFDLLLTSGEADSFISLPGAREFFLTLFTHFQSLEPKLEQLKTKEQAQLLGRELDAVYRSMVKYVNTNFRVKSPLYEHQLETARNLNQIQLISMLLMIVCVVLVTYILHKESDYHKQQSLTDSLTGISNRLALFTNLKRKIASSQPFHLFLLDLDGFKEVNDRYGHQAGDRVLKAFAERLCSLDAECYRIGGDEFAIISTKLEPQQVESATNDIHQQMREAIFVTDGTVIHVSTSVGSAHFPHDSDDLHDLMLIADSNMYREKHTSRDIDISNTMG
ncbi:GGDEF domain-containing protein [Vibrio tubiashii]|uniref:GGDEF domain-containing protein n=1 Tax=Vibrio tubiashii TaxID=29498 RepID=UPI00349EC5A8